MSFFKKLFGSKSESKHESPVSQTPLSGISTTDSFNERYEKQPITPTILDGCFKMIESYFADNKITPKVKGMINHPTNLDQVDREGFGFIMYCQAFNLEECQAIMFLALAFSDYMIKQHGFTSYRDKQPEFPLRGMTLKSGNSGAVLSLYPFEYAHKVLTGNETFIELEEKVRRQLQEVRK